MIVSVKASADLKVRFKRLDKVGLNPWGNGSIAPGEFFVQHGSRCIDTVRTMLQTAAIPASVLFGALAVLQLLLASGRPLGRFAWGGSHEVLPAKLRVGSALAIPVYAFFVILILDSVGLVEVFGQAGWTTVALWVVTVYLFLNIPLNAISRSKSERGLMTPTLIVLSLLFLYVTLNA